MFSVRDFDFSEPGTPEFRMSIRFLLIYLFGGLMIFIGSTLASAFIEAWTREAGWFDRPSETVAVLSNFIAQTWFVAIVTFVVGLTAGVWLDWLLRRPVSRDTNAGLALHALLKEGVERRNELLSPSEGFDWTQERSGMVEWSDCTVQVMKDAKVSLRLWSAFEILNKFEPEIMGGLDRSAQQVKLETIWNRKLDLLRQVINFVGD